MTRAQDTAIALPTGAALRPPELPAHPDAAPSPMIREYADVRNQCVIEASGRTDDVLTAEELLASLPSTPTASRRQWAIERDGRVIGRVAYVIPRDEGATTALVVVSLLRDAWGAGIGSAALQHLETELRSVGVRTVLHWAEHHDDGTAGKMIDSPMGVGAIPADRTARFLLKHGYHIEQVERGSHLMMNADRTRRLEALRAQAAEHAVDYRIVQWMLPTPADCIDGYAHMKSRMSTDVPDADLSLPEERWDAQRVLEHDLCYLDRGWSMQVTAAEHIGTGELCAFNELAIGPDPAGTGHQHDTLVLAGHRGHRLGTLVKAVGLLSWRERYPASAKVITYNAEQNRPMLSINEALGFTPFAYEGAWKKQLDGEG